jgi:hypothetical protein
MENSFQSGSNSTECSLKNAETEQSACQTHRPKRGETAKKTLKNSNKLESAEAKWYKARNCYRVWVPARLSEKGKDCRRFFETKEQAEKFIFEAKRSGSVELAELAVEEKHVLGVIRQSQIMNPDCCWKRGNAFKAKEWATAQISRSRHWSLGSESIGSTFRRT